MPYPELYILRHGQTVWNAEGRMQGELNSPLTAKGRTDAARQGEILATRRLKGFGFFTSPQGRAFQTAGIALAHLADTIRTDDRLREIGVGDWTGLLRDDLPMPDVPDPFIAQYEMAPGGEGIAALEVRVRAFLADLAGPAVLVTHGITSRVLRCVVVGNAALEAANIHGGQGCVYHLKDGQQKLLE
ncbi:histidine phosphatase family protein [Yoonia sediminilitoris]|uniref:Putative phosphoglycerate mutase n=1 Tax=Yoonia sediminilitoris TaxID=1286148 RepID=A0A2T6KRC2_9RHOB|nr:histidine phosphatase family protein [Yoonia sediminilitoris]PUB19112.1 putative phosphoglycerate mutase [Yoonia sediminilitoris]RCW99280.1 putative phosphoglycerate mutase [Yoonia sediminilitoris]